MISFGSVTSWSSNGEQSGVGRLTDLALVFRHNVRTEDKAVNETEAYSRRLLGRIY